MAVIDHEKLRQYADFFSERALKASRYLDRKFPDQTTYDFRSGVDFHAGFVLMEEGYKNAAAWKQKQYLHLSSWDDKAIEAGIVAKEILALKDDGSIMISEHLSETDRIFTNVRPNMSIELTEGNKRYLRYHRDNVYRGN